MMKEFATLYKRDSKGKLRSWRMEVEGDYYRTIAGLVDGEKVTSTWKKATPKNVGRANSTTAEEQAIAEVEALYKKRLEGEYHESPEDVDEARFFKPMLASRWDKRKDKIKYPVFIQPKLDGIRCLASRDGLFSRTGKPIVSVPHIWEAIKHLFDLNPNLVLDGELYNHELKYDFNSIVSMVRKTKPTEDDLKESADKVEYHVYDLINDSPEEIFLDRFLRFPTTTLPKIKVVNTIFVELPDDVDYHHERFIEDGYEGSIIRENAPYQQKRSNHLIKRKDFQDAEFEIIRIEEGLGNWSGYAKRVVFSLEDGREVGAGLKASQTEAKKILEDAHLYVGKKATIEYFNLTPDGIPRFPIAKALHKEERW